MHRKFHFKENKYEQRKTYRGYTDDRRFSWDTRGDNHCFDNNVPAVQSHFGPNRLTRDNRPTTDKYQRQTSRRYSTNFKKTYDKRNPDHLVRISRYEDISDDPDFDTTRSSRRRRNETETSRSTLDNEDRDPRRKKTK